MKRLCLLFLISLLASSACKASTEGTYEARLLNGQHMKEFNIFERNTKLPEIFIDKPRQKSYFINTFSFDKNTAFPKEKLIELVSDKIGTKLTPDDISSMKHNITQFYQANGYESAIVNISDENADRGTLLFTIFEGPKKQIEAITEPKL